MSPTDVRLRGFAERASLEQALAWIDQHGATRGVLDLEVHDAVGRVTAAPVYASAGLPPIDRAAEDGYALRAEETFGASAWAPVQLERVDAADALPRGAARIVSAGAPLPRGADAVAGFEAAQATDAGVEVITPVAQGSGVERSGQPLRAGALLLDAGRTLRPHEIAVLVSAGVERVSTVASPRVLLAVPGPKAERAPDVNTGLLRSLVTRDGGTIEATTPRAPLRDVLRAAERSGAEAVITTGRTGTGPDDDAASVLADAGEVAFHGLALRPGGSSGLGSFARIPVVLLPGDPLACLCAYELLAGRLVRRLGGRSPALPHAVREAELARKIVSTVGSVDVCQVRLIEGSADPLGIVEPGGLGAALRADGFVVVPEASEGYPPGARVVVHMY